MLLVGIPLLCGAMTPRDLDAMIPPAELPPVVPPTPVEAATFAERLGEGLLLGRLVGLTGLGLAVYAIASGRLQFDVDAVNILILFLFLGLCLAMFIAVSVLLFVLA